jgi:uncharacterized protein (TIGR03067 family)
MKAHAVSAVVLVLLLWQWGRGDESEKLKAERKDLAGTWVCESSEVDGVKRGTKESKDQTFTFDGEKFIQVDAAVDEEIEGTYQLDLSGKRKVLSTKVKVGSREVTVRYIYELTGDRLKVCTQLRSDKGLATEFSAPEGSKRMFAAFRRAKK